MEEKLAGRFGGDEPREEASEPAGRSPATPAGLRPGPGVLPRGALAPLGRALLDHHRGRATDPLMVRYDTGEEERVPVRHFFRSEEELDPLERRALDLCTGRVLDVGAGAGALSLPLVRRGHAVTALDLLPEAATVLRERGVPAVVAGDLWRVDAGGPFDTVLALMNGSGLAGTRSRLPHLLVRLAELGGDGCRILMDSTEPGTPYAAETLEHDDRGEVQIQLGYRGRRGPPFPHLFVGPDDLAAAARSVGLDVRGLERWEDGRFLARLG